MITIEPYPDDVPLAGEQAPRPENMLGLLRVLATVYARFGDTAVNYSLKWGASALWAESESRERIAKLEHALEESVFLQSHYATLLNGYDGGQRLAFTNAAEWVARLELVAARTKADSLENFLEKLAACLDVKAQTEFGELERAILARSMLSCGMHEYPPVVGEEAGERASGEMVCDKCGRMYAVHPPDWRVIGYGNVPFLNVLCDGRRVKL